MRKLLLAMMVFCAAGKTFALTPLGPPRAGLKHKQQSLGFVLASSEMDLKVSGFGMSETMKDTESMPYMVRAGFGLSDGCEIFSLIGFSDISSEGFNGSSEVAWGFGSKFTFAQKDEVTFGGVIQFCNISSDGSYGQDIAGVGWVLADIDVQLYDIQIAFGPTYTKEAFSIYGGPFMHFVDGDLDVGVLGETVTFDIEEKSEFGGYIGAQYILAESSSMFFEYQKTGDASAISGGIVLRF